MNLAKTKDYNMIGFIMSRQIRMKIYSFLMKKPSFAYEIAQSESLNVSSVLRALKELERRDIISCLNPNSGRRKFYCLTDKAKELEIEIFGLL